MALQFDKTEEEETEGAVANLAEAALSEAANIAPEALRPHIKVSLSPRRTLTRTQNHTAQHRTTQNIRLPWMRAQDELTKLTPQPNPPRLHVAGASRRAAHHYLHRGAAAPRSCCV
jgi:hypothetical protein